jgi:hypothetical protein
LPSIEAGLSSSRRQRCQIELSSSLFVIPADDARLACAHESEIRRQLAFYASTPAYRPVFDLEGWGEVADRLKILAANGCWAEMPALITDEIFDAFAVKATWAELPKRIVKKYGGLLDRVSYYMPINPGENDQGWLATVAGFKSG